MRIAQVSATFAPYWCGTANVCYHQARELARRRHEVHVFTAQQPGVPAEEMQEGLNIHRLRPLVQAGNAPLLPGLVSRLRGFDVIHLHYPFISGAELVRLAAGLYKTPLVISFHNDLIGDGARAPVFSIYQHLSAQVTVRSATRLCVVSRDHYESSRLRHSLAGREPAISELPNGVDPAHFCPAGDRNHVLETCGLPTDARVVLFVAALDRAHHFKGLGLLLQAMQSLPADVRLVVVGDGDLRQAYEQQARELGLAGRTVFAGAVPHADTPRFFRNASVTVLPSFPPESFGLVLIESMACGTPVIASAIPGVRTVVQHGEDGLLFQPGDVADLRKQMQVLLEQPQWRQAMGQQGRRKVEQHYAWPRIAEGLETIYASLGCERKSRNRSRPATRLDTLGVEE